MQKRDFSDYHNTVRKIIEGRGQEFKVSREIKMPTLSSFQAAIWGRLPEDNIRKTQELWIDKLTPGHWAILLDALNNRSSLQDAADIVSRIRGGEY